MGNYDYHNLTIYTMELILGIEYLFQEGCCIALQKKNICAPEKSIYLLIIYSYNILYTTYLPRKFTIPPAIYDRRSKINTDLVHIGVYVLLMFLTFGKCKNKI